MSIAPRGCGVKEFEGVEHCAGGDVPKAWALFEAAIVGIRVDEFIEADSDLLNAAEAMIRIAVEEENRGEPVPADPRVPVVDRLNLTLRHGDPREIVAGLAARKTHPHEVLREARLENAPLGLEDGTLA